MENDLVLPDETKPHVLGALAALRTKVLRGTQVGMAPRWLGELLFNDLATAMQTGVVPVARSRFDLTELRFRDLLKKDGRTSDPDNSTWNAAYKQVDDALRTIANRLDQANSDPSPTPRNGKPIAFGSAAETIHDQGGTWILRVSGPLHESSSDDKRANIRLLRHVVEVHPAKLRPIPPRLAEELHLLGHDDKARHIESQHEGVPPSDYQVLKTVAPETERTSLPHELRRTPDTFVGRDDVLADALHAIANGATMLALQGMPGVGKTTLALALGERLSADYPSQVFLDLRGNTATPLAPIDVMRHVIQAYRPDKALPTTPTEIAGFYYSALNGQRALLVLDNAESAAQLQPLIPPKNCFLLATSRQHFALPGLAVTELLPLAEADARQLLISIAPRCAVEAARLAKLCGFLPIALCAVGSALAETIDLKPTEFADRLERTRERLQLTDPGSNISFQASISLSCKILSRARRRSFEALGILRGSFDLDAAAAIWNITPDDGRYVLGYLVRHSLVTYDESTERYSLHDLISTFAENRVRSWRRPLLRRRHAIHFLRIASTAGCLYDHGNYRLTHGARVLQRAWTNIEPAFEYAKNHVRSLYAETLWNCSNYLAATRPPAEWLQLLRSALSTRLLLRKKTRVIYGSLLTEIAHVYIELGEPQTAREWAHRALAMAFITNDDGIETAARTELLYVAYELDEFDREVQRAVAKLDEARATNRPWFIASALKTLTTRLLIARRYRDAIPYLAERLAIIRTGEPTLPVLDLFETLAHAHYRSGEFEATAAVAREMIEFNRSHQWALYDSRAHAYLGLACAELDDEQGAALSYERQLAGICGLALSPRRLEELADEAIQWSNLSYPDRGYELATIALEGCRDQGFLRGEALALLALSLATIAHESDEAYRCCVEAAAIAESIHNRGLLGLANWALGLFSDDAGDPEAAEQYGKTALRLLENVRGIDMDLVREGLMRRH